MISVSHHLVNGLAQAANGYSEFIRDTNNITEVVNNPSFISCDDDCTKRQERCMMIHVLVLILLFAFDDQVMRQLQRALQPCLTNVEVDWGVLNQDKKLTQSPVKMPPIYAGG